MTNFTSLGLEPRLLKALTQEGYETPTPIQTQAIPHVLQGKDLLGIAQTGTGKTASFALPILQRLMENARAPHPKSARALILSPTRELAAQIADSFKAYGRYMNFNITTIFGGVSEHPQKQNMARGVDVVVATPGRLLDLVNQRAVDLTKTEIFVLDEADRMLDMGFITDIRRLVKYLPAQRQNLFFSATMPQEIGSLASDLLKDPVKVSVTPQATTVERIAQRVIHVPAADKRALLIHLLRSDPAMSRVLVFTKTKHGADKIVRALDAAGIYSSAIHGNKSQSQRVHTLNNFRAGRAHVLIATDIAARGIDVDGISHVVNFDLPHVPESYVHRIGRTARAGADGIAIAFCDREERSLLRDIEKVTRQQIPSSEWRATEGTSETGAAVLTHEQKQEFKKRREPEQRPRPPRDGIKLTKPHRKGYRPRPDADGQHDRPNVSVEARQPNGEYRNANPRPRGKGFGSDKPRGDKPFQDRAPRSEARPGEERREQRGDRPFQKRGDRPQADRPFQPRGDRPQQVRGDSPRSDRPFGDRPRGDRPQGDRPSHPRGERPQHARGDRPSQPRGDRPQGDRPQGDRPFQPRGDRPQQARGDRPFQPRGDRPQGDRPRADRPHGDRPRGDRPNTQSRPGGGGSKFPRRPKAQIS